MKDLSNFSEIIIWGTSFPAEVIGSLAKSAGHSSAKLYSMLKRNGYWDKVIMWVDSNELLYGVEMYGRSVKSPLEIKKYRDALIIVNSVCSLKPILEAIDEMGLKNKVLIVPYYFYHGTEGNPYDNNKAKKIIDIHKDDIKGMFEYNDKETQTYLDIIFDLREKNNDDLYSREYYDGTGGWIEYFSDKELAPKGAVTYIDVGAFEGDSIVPIYHLYGDRLKSCLAFEPNKNSIEKLRNIVNSYNLEEVVKIYPYALGSENKTVKFMESNWVSQVSESGTISIYQKVFDDIDNIQIVGDAMVKMDIEGSELEALHGMENFIKSHTPYLAICLYHKEEDIFEIPQYIKMLNSNYRLYLRAGWHLECWAIPERHFC